MDQDTSAKEVSCLAAELTFPDARGRGRAGGAPLVVEVIRALRPEDLQALSGAVVAPAQRLSQIKHSHHQLAKLLVTGCELAEVGLITGYTTSYISNLQNDPAFAELLSYYSIQREQIFVDVLERLKSLGLGSAEELQRRLEEMPEKFTSRELMELTELALIKPTVAAAQGKGAGVSAVAGVAIQVSFVGAQPREITDITPRKG